MADLFRLRNAGRRIFDRLLETTFGGANVWEPGPAGISQPVTLDSVIQPVLVVNSLDESPFSPQDQRIDAQVFNPLVGGQAQPLIVAEAGVPTLAQRRFLQIQAQITIPARGSINGRTGVVTSIDVTLPTDLPYRDYGRIAYAATLRTDSTFQIPQSIEDGANNERWLEVSIAATWQSRVEALAALTPLPIAGREYPARLDGSIASQLAGISTGVSALNSQSLDVPIPLHEASSALRTSVNLFNRSTTSFNFPVVYVVTTLILEVWDITGGNSISYPYIDNPIDLREIEAP